MVHKAYVCHLEIGTLSKVNFVNWIKWHGEVLYIPSMWVLCAYSVYFFLGEWGVKTSRIQKILEEVLSADYWSIWCATVGGGFFKYDVFFLENRLKYKIVIYWHVELILFCFQDPFATLNVHKYHLQLKTAAYFSVIIGYLFFLI
jgi:hypothetical protein